MSETDYDTDIQGIMDEYAASKEEPSTDDDSVATEESQTETETIVEDEAKVDVDDKPQDEEPKTQEEATEDKVEDKPAETKKPTGGINKKIKKLTAQRRQEEREKLEARAENARLQSRLDALEAANKPTVEAEKKLEDFDSIADYQKHVAKTEAQAGIDAYKQEQEARRQEQIELDSISEKLRSNEELARTEYEDYDEVMKDFPKNLPLSVEFRKALAKQPYAAHTMYDITCNEDTVIKLNQATTAKEVEQVIVEAHNRIGSEHQVVQTPQSASTDTTVEAQPQGTATLTPPKGKVMSAPPKQGKTGAIAGELKDLEGDDFYNEFTKTYN